MNGFDVQSATEVAKLLEGIARRARNFGYSMEDILDELESKSQNYYDVADRIDQRIQKEMGV